MKTLLSALFGASMLLASSEAFATKSAYVSGGTLFLSCSSGETDCKFWVEKVTIYTNPLVEQIRIFPADYPYGCGISKLSAAYIWKFDASSVNDINFSGSSKGDALYVQGGAVAWVHAVTKGGNDVVKANNYGNLDGGDGNDCLEAADGIIKGGSGDDIIGGVSRQSNSPYQLGGLTIYGQNGEDKIYGTQFDDDIDGGSVTDHIYGNGGNDTLYGGDDAAHDGRPQSWGDYIYGGEGDDYIDGGEGEDHLEGNGGDDYILGGKHDDSIWGGDGNDTILGQSDEDFIDGQNGDDQIDGGDNDDYILGGNGSDWIEGMGGHDYIQGNNDNDFILGNGGDDQLFGNDGDDQLDGGAGDDQLDGGAGTNICTP